MTDLITPADLGLPESFPEFRKGQFDIAADIASDEARFRYLSAPTGTGKSLIYAAVAQLLGARTLVLVGTKGLQNQLVHDYGAMGMADVRGANNYPCVALSRYGILSEYGTPGTMCDNGPCRVGIKCRHKREGGCGYYDTLAIARGSNIIVSNYAMWLSINRQADPETLGKFDLIVLDEAHTAPTWLAEFCSVNLDRQEVKALVNMDLPPIDEGVAVWAQWARQAHRECERRYGVMKQATERSNIKTMLRLSRLSSELVDLSRAHGWKNADGTAKDVQMPGMETDWVAQTTPKGQKFSPVWAHAYAEKYLFAGIPTVVLSSATLTPAVGKYLGIDPELSSWHEVKHGFNKRRRPFFIVGSTRVDSRMIEGQVRLWVNKIDSIISERLDRKGIIHTVSYKRAQDLLQRSKFAKYMMVHDSYNAREVIEKFKRAKPPAVLVSPSVVEGFDFPYDECRWQIIAKVPFPDGRDPLFKARKASDPEIGSYMAALAIMQMAGRSTRAKDDWSEMFMVDEHWGWFSKRVKWPAWFKESWRWMKRVPEPMVVREDMTVRGTRSAVTRD